MSACSCSKLGRLDCSTPCGNYRPTAEGPLASFVEAAVTDADTYWGAEKPPSSQPIAEGLTEAERGELHVILGDVLHGTNRGVQRWAERILADRLAAVQAERDDLAWAEMVTHQECAAKKHPDWFIDSEHNILCPWCRAESGEAERDAALAALDRVKALLTDGESGGYWSDGKGGWTRGVREDRLRAAVKGDRS